MIYGPARKFIYTISRQILREYLFEKHLLALLRSYNSFKCGYRLFSHTSTLIVTCFGFFLHFLHRSRVLKLKWKYFVPLMIILIGQAKCVE